MKKKVLIPLLVFATIMLFPTLIFEKHTAETRTFDHIVSCRPDNVYENTWGGLESMGPDNVYENTHGVPEPMLKCDKFFTDKTQENEVFRITLGIFQIPIYEDEKMWAWGNLHGFNGRNNGYQDNR